MQKQFQLNQHAAALSLPPGRADQFLVGMDSGQVLLGSLYGEAPVPKVRPLVITGCQAAQEAVCLELPFA